MNRLSVTGQQHALLDTSRLSSKAGVKNTLDSDFGGLGRMNGLK